MAKNPAGVDQTFRRDWNIDEYRAQAEAEAEMSKEMEEELVRTGHKAKKGQAKGTVPVQRQPLKARDFDLEVEKNVGQVALINKEQPGAVGYYCDVCECWLRDSNNYYNHFNGARHRKALGMSAKPEKSTLDQVLGKLSGGKRKQEQERDATLEKRLQALKEKEEQIKKRKFNENDDAKSEKKDDSEIKTEDKDDKAKNPDIQSEDQKTSEKKEEETKDEKKEIKEEVSKKDDDNSKKSAMPSDSSKNNNSVNTQNKDNKNNNNNNNNNNNKKNNNKKGQKVEEPVVEEDPLMAAFGLPSSFGSSKKNR